MPDRPEAAPTERAETAAAAALRRLPLALAVAAACFAIDRVAKIVVVEAMDLKTRLLVEVAPPWLNLLMVWNDGANFGLGDALGRDFWIGIAVVISAALLVWSARIDGRWRRIAIGAVVGGALGNALDRAIYGAVADFLNMAAPGFSNPYAFNPADIFIFVGAFALALLPGEDEGPAPDSSVPNDAPKG